MADTVNPEVKTTIVNIKAVEVDAWEMAKSLASRHDMTLGEVVSRAIRQLYQIDQGPREMPPAEANPGPKTANLTPEQMSTRIMAVAAIQQSTAALKQATGRATGLGVVSRCLADLADLLPARPPTIGARPQRAVPMLVADDDGCCHKTRLKDAPCPVGRECPHI